MTGDFEGASIDRKSEYADAGFSSMVNFYFPKRGDLDGIVYTWQAYADSLAAHDDWHPFSYLNNSYHRDADMSNMIDCATTFLLAPGVVQIFYGDETGRKLSDAIHNVDSNQAFRSDMNWSDIDGQLLAHYRKLGTIRRQNHVIGEGRQRILDTHTALRYNDADSVLIRVMPQSGQPVICYGVFGDGDVVRDLYTGQVSEVKNDCVIFPECPNNVLILKKE